MQSLTISVCSHGGSDFASIGEAIKNAGPGDIVLLKAGQYDERVVLEKNVCIKGESAEEKGSVIIAGGFVSVCEKGELCDVTIQQGVDIRSGSCKLESCDIEHGDGVKVGQGATCALVKCKISGANQLGDGIYFQEGSKGVVSGCEISNHRVNGIHLKNAEVDVIGNNIKSCRYAIYYRKGAKGQCENNTITDMSSHGIYVTTTSAPNCTKNEISLCAVQGICVSDAASGVYRDNVVKGNVHIHAGTSAVCDGNTISGFYDNEPISLSTSGSPM